MRLTRLFTLIISFLLCSIAVNAQLLKKLESSENLYKEAKRELELKHYSKAAQLCNKALEISPRNIDIHLLLGRAYSFDGKLDSARIELNYVIKFDPHYRDAYIILVNMEAVACNYDQAIEYAEMGLKYFHDDRDLLLKELDVYNKEGNWTQSNRLAEYIYDKFAGDPYIRSIFLENKLNSARQFSHKGLIESAKRAYEAVLEQDPLNKEAIEAIYNLDVRSGNYESSLSYTNRALQGNPNSYDFLMKKVGILETMQRYGEAVEVVQKLMKLFPSNPDVRKLNTYIRMEAGIYYMNTDPYLQFQAVLEKDPGNKDALNYVINIAYARGLLVDALQWTNQGLKTSPNDNNLLTKKMGLLESLKKYGQASAIAEKIWKTNPTDANKQNYLDLKTLSARDMLNDQEYDSAIIALNTVLNYNPTDMKIIDYLINAYTQQKRYDDALHTIDNALVQYPGDEHLLFKKAGLLEAYQHYADAALISKELLQRYPDSRQYLVSFVEQSLEASRQSLQYNDYYGTAGILREVLEKQPENMDALNYMINIQTAFKQYDSAIYYVDNALHYYPDNKDLIFKKSSILSDAKMYQDAYAISGELHNSYPYNIRFLNAYIEQLLASGRQMLANNQQDSALGEFSKVLEVSPMDTNALMYSINVLADQKRYDTALSLIAEGRMYYPMIPYFLLKRAQIEENLKEYNEAYLTADTLSKLTGLDPKMVDYTNRLFSQRLKNSLGVMFLRSYLDSSLPASIATIQFSHVYKKGTYTIRLNYAGRSIGTGFQFEGEGTYKVAKNWYFFGVAAYSDNRFIFPTQRYGYSVFHNLGKGWDAELGGRYLNTYNGTMISGVGSLSKEAGDFYINLRGYYISLQHNDSLPEVLPSGNIKNVYDNSISAYYSGVLTTRYYINPLNRTDYLSIVVGYGTAPDDFSRLYNITRLLSFNTVSAGIGYQKTVYYRTTIGMYGTWYNYAINPTVYRNQYDIYLVLIRKF